MERVSHYQVTLMGAVSVITVTVLNVPAQVMSFAKHHVYLACLAGVLIGTFSLWLFSRVCRRFSQPDLFAALISRSPVLGRIIALLYQFFFFIVLVRDIRVFADFTSTFMLRQTPVIILAILYVICAVAIARSGIEVIARMTELFGPIIIFLSLLLPLLLAKFIDPSAMLPLWDVDWTGIGIGTWYIAPYIGEIILLPFLFPQRMARLRHAWSGLWLGAFILLVILVTELLVMGVEIIPRLLFPTYTLARHIEITDFLDRLDLFMVALYLPTAMIKMAYSLYFICHGIHRMAPKIDGKVMAAPIGLLAMTCGMWFFRSFIGVINLQHVWTAIALIFILLFPLLFFFFLHPKQESEKA